jgi:hypothetical protein
VLVFRGPYGDGKPWAEGFLTFIGILACVMLISGYLPIPPELIKRRGRLVGFSFLFLAVDWSGAFFSLMSLGEKSVHTAGGPQPVLSLTNTVAQHSFDITFGALYALV